MLHRACVRSVTSGVARLVSRQLPRCLPAVANFSSVADTSPKVHSGATVPLPKDEYPYTNKTVDPPSHFENMQDAVKVVKSGHRVFISTASSTPKSMVQAFCEHVKSNKLSNIKTVSIHTEWPAEYVTDPDLLTRVSHSSLFTGANVRKAIQAGDAGYMPIHLSEIPSFLESIPIDVAIICVSPPDAHGFCSLGTSVDVTMTAIRHAKTVVAMVNKYMPRVHGEGIVHISQIDHAVRHDEPLAELTKAANTDFSPAEEAIGRNAAALIVDGACLQMGIGNIPNAVLSQLMGHKHLGIHSEMISDGILDLIENGNVDNSLKAQNTGATVTSFILGTKRLYDFVHDNLSVKTLPIEKTNCPLIVSQIENMTAINSCISIDLTGQINADSIGPKVFSGVGGQVDFLYGAAKAKNGKPIMALQSTTAKGASKIVPMLKPGAGVVTPRAHVRWVVTEFGSANLFGKTLPERARALVDLSHPDHREALEKDARDVLKLKLPAK